MSRGALITVCLCLSACATTPPSPESKQVYAFELEGDDKLSESDVKDKVVTTESTLWWKWFHLGEPSWFDPLTWQADLRRIQRYYEANGYYQARVLEDVVKDTTPERVELLVRLREGEPARINTLDLIGLETFAPEQQAALVADLPLKNGDVFLEDDWSRAKSLLASRLRDLGYAEATVTGEAVVEAEAARVDLTLTVVPGLKYSFGTTFVVPYPGARLPAKDIAEVAKPDLEPGTPFSEEALAKAQARVLQMGVFAGVRVNRGLPDRKNATVPVVVDAREGQFNSIRIGGGIGGDLIRQEARAVFEYTNRDLGFSRLFSKDSRLDRLTLKAKLGLAVLPNIVDVIRAAPLSKWGPTFRVFAEYEVPRVFNQRTLSFQGSVDTFRTLDNTYDYYGLEGKLGLVWRPRVDLSVFPSLNANGFLLQTPVELRENVPTAAIGCPQAPQVCLVAFVQIATELDRRDDKLEPKEGFFLSLDLAGGVSSTTQLRPFFKVTPEARGYVSFGKNRQFTVAGRLKAGSLFAPENDTPIVVRYFSGGAGMRGFYQRRLSPQIAVPVSANDETCKDQPECPYRTLPLGGAGLLEGALELRWQFAESWVLALFNDWGLVTTAPLGAATRLGQQLYTAIGLGVRYRTPLGPIRVDVAFRLPFVGGPQEVGNLGLSETGSTKQVLSLPGCFFGLGAGMPWSTGAQPAPYGGSPDNLCSAHLSIGEAF